MQTLAAIAAVFCVQYLLGKLRLWSPRAANMLDNDPVLLFERGAFCDEAMRTTRVTRASVLEKIRMSGANSVSEVNAVVLETTGDISVISGDNVSPDLLSDVRRYDRPARAGPG